MAAVWQSATDPSCFSENHLRTEAASPTASYLLGCCYDTRPQTVCMWKSLILLSTYPRHCDRTNPLQLKIAHNQSAGRRISVLLKCINVKGSEPIDGWQDSKSIDIGPALWHNKLTHTYFLCLCPLSHPVLVSLEKNICQLSKACEGQMKWPRSTELGGTSVCAQKHILLLILFVVL